MGFRGRYATVEARDFANLVSAWKDARKGGYDWLIGEWSVEEPLTPTQLRRLPLALRELLISPAESRPNPPRKRSKGRSHGDAVDYLERLFTLEDTRR